MTETPNDGRRDFDFLHGEWRVHNRRLVRALAPEQEWQEFESTATVRPILHGLGNIDSISIPALPGVGPFEGATLRLFDPESATWTIHWASTGRPGHLDPGVRGRFTGRHGTFDGTDVYDGRPIDVRFAWSHDGDHTARWEQSFSAGDERGWEVNWVMEFERAG